MYTDTDVLKVLGYTPGTAVSELCHFWLPHCSEQCLSEETLKAVGPLCMVPMPWELNFPTLGVNV